MKQIDILVALAALLLVSASAHADQWKHACLTASDGTRVSIDFIDSYLAFNDVGGPAGHLATPLWINLENTGSVQLNNASVSIANYGYDRRLPFNDFARQMAVAGPTPTVINLNPDPANQNHYSGSAQGVPLEIADTGTEFPGSAFFQKVTVTVARERGEIQLQDPVTKQNYFEVQLNLAGTDSCN